MSVKDEFLQHLTAFHTSPFLFIGSGVSRRYLDVEDWEGLLRRFASLTSRPYEYFRSSADGKYPAIATEIAKDIQSIWWESSRFEESRQKYQSDASTRESALKIEISRYLQQASVPQVEDRELRAELDILPRVTIDGVITTNWDLLLEHVFPEMEVYAGQDELLFSTSHGVGEIYKIHGCCSRPNSLVATKADYERFNERNAYLAAKLLTVFAEHPIVFLGYSLTDENISAILQSIAQCLTTTNIGQLRDRLILIQWDSSAKEQRWENNNIVVNGVSLPVRILTTNSFLPVFEALAELPRRFPARILRKLKEHVYELVSDNDPAGRLHVIDIDDATDLSQVEVVFGVGLRLDRLRFASEDELEAIPVRLSEDPDAPVIPFRVASLATYPNIQAELEAFVASWRSDNQAYVSKSRLCAFYANRLDLQLSEDAAKCLLISAMHHGAPIHYWAHKLTRPGLQTLLKAELALDLFPRIRSTARLAFALGMSAAEELLTLIAKQSRYVTVRNLAMRLNRQIQESSTIYAEYKSPVRSVHILDGEEVTIDVTTVLENQNLLERVLTQLATSSEQTDRTRLWQLDAYFYGRHL